MATPFDGISQRLDFASGGEDSSSDNSSDDYAFRIRSPRVVSRGVLNPESACRTPRVQRHHSRSSTVSPSIQCSNPIPYGTWRKLRLSDSPSTPKVRQQSLQMKQTCSLQLQTPVVGIICCLSPSLQSLLSRSSQPYSSTKIRRTQRTLRFVSTAPSLIHDPLSVNVNPFTPETVRRSSKLLRRNDFVVDDEDYRRRYKQLRRQHLSSLIILILQCY